MQSEIVPIVIYIASAVGLAVFLLVLGNVLNPRRPSVVKRMPYESGMDPLHDTRRRFDVRFHLMAIAFLVFDVELLFLYPWAVAIHRPRQAASPGVEVAAGDANSRAAEAMSQPGGGTAPNFAADNGAKAKAPATVRAGTATPKAAGGRAVRSAGGALAAGGVRPAFVGGLIFLGLLVVGFVYDWKKGVFQWR